MAERSDSGNDHPQTIKSESDARGTPSDQGSGGALFKEQQDRAQDHSTADEQPVSEQASPLGDAQSALGDDADTVRAHATGARSMGDALGSSAGRDVGSGTDGDTGDLGGGDPGNVGS